MTDTHGADDDADDELDRVFEQVAIEHIHPRMLEEMFAAFPSETPVTLADLS